MKLASCMFSCWSTSCKWGGLHNPSLPTIYHNAGTMPEKSDDNRATRYMFYSSPTLCKSRGVASPPYLDNSEPGPARDEFCATRSKGRETRMRHPARPLPRPPSPAPDSAKCFSFYSVMTPIRKNCTSWARCQNRSAESILILSV